MTIPQNVISRLNELPIEEVACKLGLEVKKHKTLCFKHNDHNPSITFPTIRTYINVGYAEWEVVLSNWYKTRMDGTFNRHAFGWVKSSISGGSKTTEIGMFKNNRPQSTLSQELKRYLHV